MEKKIIHTYTVDEVLPKNNYLFMNFNMFWQCIPELLLFY